MKTQKKPKYVFNYFCNWQDTWSSPKPFLAIFLKNRSTLFSSLFKGSTLGCPLTLQRVYPIMGVGA